MFAPAQKPNQVDETMTNALCSRSCPAPTFVRADLCARMAPLDSYGLNGVSSALVDGLSALASVSMQAISALRHRASS
jgi:hypothetical protein